MDSSSTLREGHLFLTWNGKPIMSFRFDSTTDKGITLGPSMEGNDIHLTVWENMGKVRYHVRHKGIKEPADESPLSAQKSSKLVANDIEKMIKKRLKTYNRDSLCWAFTFPRWEKIKSILPKTDLAGNVYVPLEINFAQLDMDFSKSDLWIRVRIQELLTTEPFFGFKEIRRELRLVKPISKNQMLAWPLSKVDEIQRYMLEVFGIDQFFQYLENTPEGRQYISQAQSKLRQLIGL